MQNERFAIPCVGAIIEKEINGEPHLLIQTRQKENGNETNGLLELPAGKIREYEDIFSALRREVWEETGLTITRIHGEEAAVRTRIGEVETLSFAPYCTTQNLSGAYSIILHTFLCDAEGKLLSCTNETQNIRWAPLSEVRYIVSNSPEKIFFMHINALRKYLRL